MVKRNPHFDRLPKSYLFKRMQEIAEGYEEVLDLSIGDTSLPLLPEVSMAMEEKARLLGTQNGYQGYGPAQGEMELRKLIAKKSGVEPSEVFISDGAKCDIGRLQMLFGQGVSIAVQDPAYPVYGETSLLLGQNRVIPMPCHRENGFFPELQRADLIYFCSPHNPTGYAATKEELGELVTFAKREGSIIIFDSAYADFIRNPLCPRSIYEIDGAKEVAIEVSSFSKSFGFTGVRLGWTIIPHALRYSDGRAIHPDFFRIACTFFNGASNIAQAGGIAALQLDSTPLIQAYQKNADLLREASMSRFFTGGENAPYLFVDFGRNSWQAFESLLKETGILAIPGSGFGPYGEGYLRISALAKRKTVEEAAHRLHDYFGADLRSAP